MTYPELRAVIQTYSQDFEASFVENIDTFIELAESRILLRVRLPRFRKDVTATMVATDNLLATPSDFLAPDSFSVVTANGLVFPQNKDSEFLDECYPDPTEVGIPRFYCYLNESSLKFGPAPDQNYPANLGYFYQPPSITTAGTTWLGNFFAHALVSGSLLEASKYTKAEDNLYARFDAAFEKDLAMDQQYAKGRTRKDTYETPDVRSTV
jgi:hypothetical protein